MPLNKLVWTGEASRMGHQLKPHEASRMDHSWGFNCSDKFVQRHLFNCPDDELYLHSDHPFYSFMYIAFGMKCFHLSVRNWFRSRFLIQNWGNHYFPPELECSGNQWFPNNSGDSWNLPNVKNSTMSYNGFQGVNLQGFRDFEKMYINIQVL